MKRIYNILAQDLEGMSWRQHFCYWVFPLSLMSLLLSFFFSGSPVLVELINPKMNKEWGLLENIQLVVVAFMIVISAYAAFKKRPALQKFGFALVCIFAVFVFLEEIDYGAHFIQYFTGERQSQLGRLTGVYNIHNYGDWTAKIFKRVVYVLMLITFMIAPFLKERFKVQIISYLIPKPRIIITACVTILQEIIARALIPLNNMKLEELTMDIGEFSEILVYYVFLLYLWQLIFEKKWGTTK